MITFLPHIANSITAALRTVVLGADNGIARGILRLVASSVGVFLEAGIVNKIMSGLRLR